MLMASPLQLVHEAMVMQESGERVAVVSKQPLGGAEHGLALVLLGWRLLPQTQAVFYLRNRLPTGTEAP